MSETIFDHEKLDAYRKVQSSTSTAMLSTSTKGEQSLSRGQASFFLCVNMNPIRAGLADKPENAEHTSTHARLQDRMAGDVELSQSGWLAAVHVDGDGHDGVAAGRRASNKRYLGIVFREYLELLDALIRRERIERAGGTSSDYPSVLERLGVTAAMWESAVQVTSRRFARELDIMAMMFAEARRRG